MMQNRWLGYLIGLFLTAAVAGGSMMLPGELLRRQEADLIGKVVSLEETPRPTASRSEKKDSEESMDDLYEKIRLLNDRDPIDIQPREPSGNEMSMKEAIQEGEKQLVQLAALGAVPKSVLEYLGFKAAAKLGTIRTLGDDLAHSFWYIIYSPDPGISNLAGNLRVTLDAVTGKVYSILWQNKDGKDTMNAVDMGMAYVQYLNIQAKPQKVSGEGNYAFLLSKDGRLVIHVSPVDDDGLGMHISVGALAPPGASDRVSS